MDTKKNLFFWVERIISVGAGSQVLCGRDFDGGLNIAVCDIGRDKNSLPFWVVSESGSRRFDGQIVLLHSQHFGHHLELVKGVISTLPCLLTSDPNVRLAYHGPASIKVLGEPFSLEEVLAEGLPLKGENWLGVARIDEMGEVVIDIFTDSLFMPLDSYAAYYPDWSDRLGAEEGQFVVSISR